MREYSLSSKSRTANILSLINLLTVEWYGETEFWAALGKVLLIIGKGNQPYIDLPGLTCIIGLIIFTFIVMLGGNPLGDRFGFRYWNNPVRTSTQKTNKTMLTQFLASRVPSLLFTMAAILVTSLASSSVSFRLHSPLLDRTMSVWQLVRPRTHVSLCLKRSRLFSTV